MQSSRIRAEVQIDSHVIVPQNRNSVKIEALATIHNDSDDHYVLGAPDPASAHSWQLLDADGNEVERQRVGRAKKVKGATDSACSTMVPSRHSVREMETIRVAASKLEHGARYTLRHSHWGYIGEAEFVAVHEPERAAAPKKAAKKSKKAVKKPKKAVKKTTPTRKPAKKKPAAKRKPATKKAAAKRNAAKKKAAPGKKAARKKAGKS